MPGDKHAAVAYAVRGRAILKYHGELCASLAGIAVVPAIVAALVGDWTFALRAAGAGVLLGGVGLALSRMQGPDELQANEALVIVALGFLLTSALMAWPLAADGLGPLDAFFHAMSAVTTTGLATIDSFDVRSAAFLFTQAWMQWYGGLVIVVLAVFLIGPGSAAKQVSSTEGTVGDHMSGTRARAYRSLIVYSILTAMGWLLLLVLGAAPTDALLYTLSAISTGGFAPHDSSLAAFDAWFLRAGVMAITLVGTLSLDRYYKLSRWRSAGTQALRTMMAPEVITLLALCALGTVLCGWSMWATGIASWGDAVRNAPLLAVSAQTTSGFTPMPVPALDGVSKLVLAVSMLIGGDIGSTAGGIKLFRFLVVARLVRLVLLRPALPPHAVSRPELAGKPLEERDVLDAVGIVALYFAVVLVSWTTFIAFGHAPLDSLFEVASATGTVGLSSGLSSPRLQPFLKAVLCVDMWMGRLEVLAVLVLVYPRTWLGRRAELP